MRAIAVADGWSAGKLWDGIPSLAIVSVDRCHGRENLWSRHVNQSEVLVRGYTTRFRFPALLSGGE
jgi:hypothetical protein